jgi:putative membrane protein
MIMEKNKVIKNFLYGIILGVSNVIPGVSGGTMAVILNIYDKVLLALSRKNIKSNLPLLIPLGLGILVGIYFFSKLVTDLMEDYNPLLTFAFFGIILGSIPLIFQRARYERVKTKNVILGLLSLVFMIVIAYISSASNPSFGEVQLMNREFSLALFYIWLFLSSFLAMIAMLLPGISGSLILLILGAYPITMEAIALFQWNILAVLALGVLVGGYTGVKGIQNMLNNHPQALYFIILGLVAGSLFILFPGLKEGFTSPLSYIIFFIFAGLSLVFSLRNSDNN